MAFSFQLITATSNCSVGSWGLFTPIRAETSLPSGFFKIRHPDGRTWRVNAANELRLDSGNIVYFKAKQPSDLYGGGDRVALFIDGDSQKAISHGGFVMWSTAYVADNINYPWLFEASGSSFNIWNDFDGGYYVGVDSTGRVLIVTPTDSQRISWIVEVDDYKCLPCPRSTFTTGVGFTSCSLCAAGTFTENEGSTTCSQCAAGTFGSITRTQVQDRVPMGFFRIKHPDGRSWRVNGEGNEVHLNIGADLIMQTFQSNGLYQVYGPRVALFINGNSAKAIAHGSLLIFLDGFRANDINFPYLFEASGSSFTIFNDFLHVNGGHYVGYDSADDRVKLVPPSDAKRVSWNLESEVADCAACPGGTYSTGAGQTHRLKRI